MKYDWVLFPDLEAFWIFYSFKLLIVAGGSREKFRSEFGLTFHNFPAIISAASTHSCYISCCSAFIFWFLLPPAAETNITEEAMQSAAKK